MEPATENSQQSQERCHISTYFYQWQFLATLMWWVIVKATTGKMLDQVTHGSVFTCPSWLASKWVHQLQRPTPRKCVFSLALVAMAVGGWGIPMMIDPQQLSIRIIVASLVSLYHLVESSVTHRHGEYPLLYNVWAMCLSSPYAHAASWGIAIHFVMSTGMAKMYIGKSDWMSPSTMKFYLTAYHNAKIKLSRPFAPLWNIWICERDWATRSISISTLTLECILGPLTLLFPSNLRFVGSLAMIVMHIGIFLFMSKKVGIVFATTLPTYLIGFQCPADLGTSPWWCAVAVALLPTILSFGILGRPLPEDWPSSPVSLFMWSGEQAKVLAETLMTGDTRLVLGTVDKTRDNIMGLPVIHHGAVAPIPATTINARKLGSGAQQQQADQAVHDCVLRVIGFTILQTDLACAVPQCGNENQWDTNRFVKTLQQFLESKERLCETQSGQPLVAFFIRMDSKGNCTKVLAAG